MEPQLIDFLHLAKLTSGRRIALYNQWRPLLVGHGLTPDPGASGAGRGPRPGDQGAGDPLGGQHVKAALLPGDDRGQRARQSAALRARAADSGPDRRISGQPSAGAHGVAAADRAVPGRRARHRPAAQCRGGGGLGGHRRQAAGRPGRPCDRVGSRATGRSTGRRRGRVPPRRSMRTAVWSRTRRSVEANRRGRGYLAAILCMVMGHFYDQDDAAHMAAQALYLEPLMEHDRRARADRRARRRRGSEPDADAPQQRADPGGGIGDERIEEPKADAAGPDESATRRAELRRQDATAGPDESATRRAELRRQDATAVLE